MNRKSLYIGICSTMIISSSVFGSGFALNEYSVSGIGRAFAGMGIVGDDYSSIISNPAAMVYNKSGFQIGSSLVNINAKVKHPQGQKTDLSVLKGVPYLFGQFNINEKVNVGAALYTPYGMEAEYKKDWFGRDAALRSKLVVYNFTLSSSYQLSSKWAVGASLGLSYASANLTNDVTPLPAAPHLLHSDIRGKSKITPVYSLGLVYNKSENTRFGLSYKSKSKYNLNGKHKITLNAPFPGVGGSTAGQVIANAGVNASVTLPESILFSAYHKIEKFGISGSINWINWSRFKYLDIYSKASINGNPVGKQSTYENWKNSLMLALGLDYDLSDKWILRTGLTFDETPIRSDDYRTARIPDDNRFITSFGGSYKFNNGKLDLGYSHIFLNGGTAKYASGKPLNAKYDLSLNIIGASVQYYF